ncbi:hypothetical protein IU501_01775 [Nocardia otitidiscaviarum]|uniref:hypothetical protein n=1 Tax=Nocardia otitidiscaviarum TaxID=1823 RepID=UPI0018958B9E|nr:hypothetical protein [Nocardia otitidiscaviarum]MBF6131735.1 hypothetical protein [Nocardia otitidiscaviarum]
MGERRRGQSCPRGPVERGGVAGGAAEGLAAFIATATEIAARHTVPGHPVADIWINIGYAAAGGWGIGGVAYTDEALVSAITAASSAS